MTSKLTFEDAWKQTKNSIFRLESFPKYKVPEDLEIFEKWKKGQNQFGAKPDLWLQNIKATKELGIVMERVRVVSLPISEYIRYEIDYWKFSIRNGENILFIGKEDFNEIKRLFNFKLKDFWFFDDKTLIIFYYDDGNFIKECFIDDEKVIEGYKKLKYKLLEKALPMERFLLKYEE